MRSLKSGFVFSKLLRFLEVLFVYTLDGLTISRLTVSALQIKSLDVPSPVVIGESVEMTCVYDLENEPLYSIKWYKDDREFYRFVPNDRPPGQFLPLPGIKVDLSKSNTMTVYLKNVDLNSSGKYTCEVSAEAPSFATEEIEKSMKVLVLPTEGPQILGGRSRYREGDTVNINCTSSKSKPAAVLKWFINGRPAQPEYELEHSTTLHADGLESSSLGLRFTVNRDHFQEGNMRLKCMANISRIYTMTNEEVVFPGYQHSSDLHIAEDYGHVSGKAPYVDISTRFRAIWLVVVILRQSSFWLV